MMSRLFRNADFEPARGRVDDFDPIAEGNSYRLAPAVSLAIWKRVCLESTNQNEQRDEQQARQRFHQLASRVALRGGRLQRDPGRETRYEAEILGMDPDSDMLGSDTPGKTTQVLVEARRWERRMHGTEATGDDAELSQKGEVNTLLATMLSGARDSMDPHCRDVARGRAAPAGARIDRRAAGPVSTNSIDALFGTLSSSANSRLPGGLAVRLSHALDRDVTGVRVHTGPEAADAAAALGAEAFTLGDDVYFARGQYAPGTAAGDRLIAHEVAHTVQQQGAASTGEVEVSSPHDAHEVEAERFAESFVNAPIAPPVALRERPDEKRIVEPAAFPMVSRVSRRVLSRFPMPPNPYVEVGVDPVDLFPARTLNKKWDILKPNYAPLAKGAILIGDIPVTYQASAGAEIYSFANAFFGPARLENMKLAVSPLQAVDRWVFRGPLGKPLVNALYGPQAAKADLNFSTGASAGIKASAKIDGDVAAFDTLYAGAYAGLSGSATASASLSTSNKIWFAWDSGVASVGHSMDIVLKASLAFALNAYAGVKVGLRMPHIPVLSDLTHAVQDWPIVGWIVPDLTKLKWEQKFERQFPIYNKTKDWMLQQHFHFTGRSPSAASGEEFRNDGFDASAVLKELQDSGSQMPTKDDGPAKELKDGANPGVVSGRRESAKAQIASTRRTIKREKTWNATAMIKARAAAAAAPPSSGTGPPSLAITTAPKTPVAALEARDGKLDQADRATNNLEDKTKAIQPLEGSPDGPTRNQAREGYTAIGDNADKLGDAIDGDDRAFERPGEVDASNADSQELENEIRSAAHKFDRASDAVMELYIWAHDEEKACGSSPEVIAYKAKVKAFRIHTDHMKQDLDKLEADIEKAREWYTRGPDYATGITVFRDQLSPRCEKLQTDATALEPTKPQGDWDTDYAVLEDGKLMLLPIYRKGKAVRRTFYPHDYRPATKKAKLAHIGGTKMGADGQVYWVWNGPMKSPRGDNLWRLDIDDEAPTIAHNHPTVVDHWNIHHGNAMGNDGRADYYNLVGKPMVVEPKHYNDTKGGEEDGEFTFEVKRTFRGR